MQPAWYPRLQEWWLQRQPGPRSIPLVSFLRAIGMIGAALGGGLGGGLGLLPDSVLATHVPADDFLWMIAHPVGSWLGPVIAGTIWWYGCW